MAKKKGNRIGSWAFLIGLVVAVIVGLMGQLGPNLLLALVLIGLIVGLFNIADEEVTPFLMSGTVLIIATAFGGQLLSSVNYIGPVFDALLVLFVPATIVVAIKNVFQLATH